MAVLALGLACQCLPVLPDPTSKTVPLDQIAGNYTYQYNDQTVTVHLNVDGTFEILDSLASSGVGTWQLDGAEITLHYSSPPKLVSGWYVYEDDDGEFAIMGGEGDPDGWSGLRRAP